MHNPHHRMSLQKFTAFNLDEFVAGKSKTWTFWNCDPSEFPWSYAKDEYAYVIAGKFSVQYEGELFTMQRCENILWRAVFDDCSPF